MSQLALGFLRSKAVEFTRPANTTAYTAGDVVSNSTSATTPITFSDFFRAPGASAYIVGCLLTTDQKSITPRFRVHLYNVSTATLSVDNAAHQDKYADIGKKLGSFVLAAMATATDTTNSDQSWVYDFTIRIPVVAASTSRAIYATLETLDAFTPTSGEKFTLALIPDCN